MIRRCLITYEDLEGEGPYSPSGLRRLSPRLTRLHDLPFDRAELLREAARLASKIWVQGVQPKLSLRLDVSGGRFVVVETRGTYILKPQNPLWTELPENEDLTMRLAAACGIEVPLHGLLRARDGSLAYVVKRFDRVGRRSKLPLEDFAQLSGKSRETKYASSMEQVAGILDAYSTFPAIEKERLFLLTLFCFLCGNEDMHLKNFSLTVTTAGISRLSPAYDLVCTTIALAEAREEVALPLHGKRRGLTRGDLVDYFGFERLGLSTASVEAALSRLAGARTRWRELVERSFLSSGTKARYAALLEERSARLGLWRSPIAAPHAARYASGMRDDPYASLALALDRLPNGYPRTDSGVELLILRKLVSPEEAALAALLGKDAEPAEAVAERAGKPAADVRQALNDLVRRGLVWPGKGERGLVYRLAPFIVGIYESQVASMDHELAHLVEDYMAQGGAKGIMGPLPSLHRVMPAHGSVKSEWILPYDDVRALLLDAKAFSARDCICRREQELLGTRACTTPMHNCLSFSPAPRSPRPGDVTRDEALAILDQAEEAGLVHTVSNVLAGVSYVCNCCGCCCGILRGITEYGLEHSVAAANYRATVDAERCTGCEVCVERCQVAAVSMRDGIAAVEAGKCIGCGLCVTGCAAGAAALLRKPESEVVHPPADFAAWERARLARRAADR